MDILEVAKKYRLIIWDFDGTIVNLCVDWKRLKKELMGMLIPYVQNMKNKDLSLNDLIYLLEQKFPRDTIFKIIEEYELKAEYFVNEISLRMIVNFYKLGLLQCILSDNTTKTIKTILNKLQILDFFDTIIGKDSVKKFKPNPEGLRKILKYYNIDKSQILYIGDSWKDEAVAHQEELNFLKLNEIDEKWIKNT